MSKEGRRKGGSACGLKIVKKCDKKIIKILFVLFETTIHNIITTKSTKKSLGALNQVDSYMTPLRGCQKTLVRWRHENKFSFLHLTRVFLNNLRMFNIYQPDSIKGESFV